MNIAFEIVVLVALCVGLAFSGAAALYVVLALFTGRAEKQDKEWHEHQ